ncbi:MAG: branched-chain amino acid ABC transporter permease [Rubrivivax sp.]|nr:branched-chain amino acid ABC transporter permease [Rubrivivax sp.]
MNRRNLGVLLALALAAVPLFGPGKYALHLMVMGLLWSYIYTSWSIMGRLGLVSFGHGAFLGIGAYTVVMLWNAAGVSPWLGAVVAVVLTLAVALLIGLPCFRFKIVGHYFALVTLALSEVTRLIIVGLRDHTGGSLGLTPKPALTDGATASLWALQFSDKAVWFYIVFIFWLGALFVWHRVDRGMNRLALQAISEEEDAAASIGIDVTRAKLTVTLISAAMTCLGGVLYAQYQLYVNPETVSGIGISLQMVFGVIAGGLFVMLGPTVGAVFLLVLSESLRVLIGNQVLGVDITIYGLLLVIFIIYMPKGILGTALQRFGPARATPPATARPLPLAK